MEAYFLFIDTEASGLPVNWALPYSAEGNWPYAVQISWLIYDQQQNLVKKEDHYISVDGFTITWEAEKIHGLTVDFLNKNGKSRDEVMQLLATDLLQYKPMIIGHFIRLDYYILSAAFYRSGMANPLHGLPVFCTMVATRRLTRNVVTRHLRLEELYRLLFNAELEYQHNALNDAQATADCFYELLRNSEISTKSIQEQNKEFEEQRDPTKKPKGCLLPILIVIVLLAVFILYRL